MHEFLGLQSLLKNKRSFPIRCLSIQIFNNLLFRLSLIQTAAFLAEVACHPS